MTQNMKTEITDALPSEPNILDGPLEGSNPYRHPGFAFAGANLGGQAVQTCLGCWAYVADDATERHLAWHVASGA